MSTRDLLSRDKPNRADTVKRDLPITELLSYRLNRVASAFSRSAALKYRRDFGVNLGEWRALGLLGAEAASTLNRLARLAGFDKAQMSRIVSKLVERGLVQRAAGPGGCTHLTLTLRGQATYDSLISAARVRNEAFLNCLTQEEVNTLDSALNKLVDLAIEVERDERKAR